MSEVSNKIFEKHLHHLVFSLGTFPLNKQISQTTLSLSYNNKKMMVKIVF